MLIGLCPAANSIFKRALQAKKGITLVNQAANTVADEGAAALTLQRLLARLGVSHGSFYHHFANRQALTDAMLAYWEQHMTVDIVADSDRSRDTGQ